MHTQNVQQTDRQPAPLFVASHGLRAACIAIVFAKLAFPVWNAHVRRQAS